MFNTWCLLFFVCSSWNPEKSRRFFPKIKDPTLKLQAIGYQVILGSQLKHPSWPGLPSTYSLMFQWPETRAIQRGVTARKGTAEPLGFGAFQEKGILALAGFLDHSRHTGWKEVTGVSNILDMLLLVFFCFISIQMGSSPFEKFVWKLFQTSCQMPVIATPSCLYVMYPKSCSILPWFSSPNTIPRTR